MKKSSKKFYVALGISFIAYLIKAYLFEKIDRS